MVLFSRSTIWMASINYRPFLVKRTIKFKKVAMPGLCIKMARRA